MDVGRPWWGSKEDVDDEFVVHNKENDGEDGKD